MSIRNLFYWSYATRWSVVVLAAEIFFAVSAAKAQWTPPTPEELAMTSLPQAPGASAVYLFREELQQDGLHMYSKYVRLKVLTEGGKDRANVELKYASGSDAGTTVTDIAGRTIHPDGTVIPFSGKPYERMVVKAQGYTIKAKVFTLPDVTVGSIIEYRYKLRWDDNRYISPDWIVQDDVYLRKAHFLWRPTDEPLVSSDERGQLVSTVAWTPILPAGVALKQTTLAGGNFGHEGHLVLELNIENIPPSPEEEYMPPLGSLGYRVLFYFSPYKSPEEYWKGEGKHWSKVQDKFIGPGGAVRSAVQQLTLPGDTQEQKLKKLYAAVEQLENTDYTRERSRREDKAEGLSQVKTTDDIWNHKRGSSDQIAALFVAMARAAGMKAYLMAVTDRSRSIFYANYLSLSQLDDDVAIVNVEGKEQYFDPGSRYCPYGHVAWKHADTGGLRQTDAATVLTGSSGENYLYSGVARVANLNMDEAGVVSGKVNLKFTGSSALKWRQKALTDDKDAVEREMKESLEHMLPSNIEVKLVAIDKLQDYEESLVANFTISGPIASATGKRLVITGDLFEGNSKPTFAHDKRELGICFPYRYNARDVVRINLPGSFQVESVPPESLFKLQKSAAYSFKSAADGKSVTIRRDLYVGDIFYPTKDYPDIRTFYTQFETKDQEPIILKVAAASPTGN